MLQRLRYAFLLLAFIASPAFADASERRFVREGMAESEVLMKLGRPDSESTDSGGGAKVAVKRWIYFPAPGDSQTMTTLVLRDGKVTSVERQVAR
jgi:hypothetical protein